MGNPVLKLLNTIDMLLCKAERRHGDIVYSLRNDVLVACKSNDIESLEIILEEARELD